MGSQPLLLSVWTHLKSQAFLRTLRDRKPKKQGVCTEGGHGGEGWARGWVWLTVAPILQRADVYASPGEEKRRKKPKGARATMMVWIQLQEEAPGKRRVNTPFQSFSGNHGTIPGLPSHPVHLAWSSGVE